MVLPAGSTNLAEGLLGLSPAAEIIRAHRGGVEIQREVGELIIRISLPVL